MTGLKMILRMSRLKVILKMTYYNFTSFSHDCSRKNVTTAFSDFMLHSQNKFIIVITKTKLLF